MSPPGPIRRTQGALSPIAGDERERRAAPGRNVRRVLRTSIDPVANAILERLAVRPATTAEVADALGTEVEVVRRWMRGLRRDGQVVTLGKVTWRGGRSENLYAIDLRANLIEGEELDAVPRRQVEEAHLAVLRAMFRETAAALEAGTFDRRHDHALIRLPMPLDEDGYEATARLHRRLFLDVTEEVESSARRLASSSAEPIASSIFILLFGLPSAIWPLHSREAAESTPARRRRAGGRVERLLDLTDPLRNRILDALLIAPAGAGSLGALLGIPVAKVRYELGRLHDDGLVTIRGSNPVRGTVEHVFVAEPGARILSDADHAAHPGPAGSDYGRWLTGILFREGVAAIRGGAQFPADDPVLVRIPTVLDLQGFAAISALIVTVTTKLLALRERSLTRLEGAVTPGLPTVSGLLLFERAAGAPIGRGTTGDVRD